MFNDYNEVVMEYCVPGITDEEMEYICKETSWLKECPYIYSNMVKLYHKNCSQAGKMKMRKTYERVIIRDGLGARNSCPLIAIVSHIAKLEFALLANTHPVDLEEFVRLFRMNIIIKIRNYIHGYRANKVKFDINSVT